MNYRSLRNKPTVISEPVVARTDTQTMRYGTVALAIVGRIPNFALTGGISDGGSKSDGGSRRHYREIWKIMKARGNSEVCASTCVASSFGICSMRAGEN